MPFSVRLYRILLQMISSSDLEIELFNFDDEIEEEIVASQTQNASIHQLNASIESV